MLRSFRLLHWVYVIVHHSLRAVGLRSIKVPIHFDVLSLERLVLYMNLDIFYIVEGHLI